MQPEHSAKSDVHLRKSLRLWQVVVIGLAYIAPMTVFDTLGIVSDITAGHVPSAYVLALLGILFTAISYGTLVRRFPQSGSAYTTTQRAINPHVGFLVGWSSLLDYLLLPMVNALLAKLYLSAMFPDVPEWVWVAGFVTLISLINMRSVNLVAFSFVNLAVINHCYLREGRNQSLGDKLRYLILPTIGFCIIALLWLDLDEHSLLFGGTWALFGVLYLTWLTKSFRVAPPTYIAE